MKNTLTIAACFFFVQLVAQTKTTFGESEQMIKDMPSKDIVMGVAGGIMIDGTFVWGCSSGFSDEDNGVRFTQSTLSRTASIAKPMTSIAVLQLFEKGLVQLDEAIQTYVPEFPIKEEGTITVRHLLNHSSGIGAYKNNKEAFDADHYPTLMEAMNVFKDRRLLGTPGEEEFYSTYGYVVLGVLIEKVTGQSYEAYMQANVWDKVGMPNTGIEKKGVKYLNKSMLYHRKKNGKLKRVPFDDLSNRVPGGGFYSNIDDLLKFGQAILDNSLISEETLALMLEEQGTKYDGNPYALGWFLYSQNGERKDIFGHSGAQKGCSTQIMLIPKHKTVVAVMANTSGTGSNIIGTSAKMIEEAVAFSKESENQTD